MEWLRPLCAILFLTTSGIFDKPQILQWPVIFAVVRPTTNGIPTRHRLCYGRRKRRPAQNLRD
jgi:hypothetical protein